MKLDRGHCETLYKFRAMLDIVGQERKSAMTSCVVGGLHDNSKQLRGKELRYFFDAFETLIEPRGSVPETREDGSMFLETVDSIVHCPISLTKMIAQGVSEIIFSDNPAQWANPSLEAAVDKRSISRDTVSSAIAI